MNEIKLVGGQVQYTRIKGFNKAVKTDIFNVAYAEDGNIYLLPCPKLRFNLIEDNMEYIINHETLHNILEMVVGRKTSIMFDNLNRFL